MFFLEHSRFELLHPTRDMADGGRGYFSAEAGSGTRGFYYGLAAAFAVYTIISVFGVLLAPECDRPAKEHRLPYSNLDFPNDPCRNVRYVRLGGLTKFECDMCTRILMSLVFGSIVGFERRRADRFGCCPLRPRAPSRIVTRPPVMRGWSPPTDLQASVPWQWSAWARASSRSTPCLRS